jgi:hypothetical protein
MAALGMRRPRVAQANIERLALTEQLWQLGDIARYASRFIKSYLSLLLVRPWRQADELGKPQGRRG